MTTCETKAKTARELWQASADELRGAETRRNEIVEQRATKAAKDWKIDAYAETQARGAALAEVTELLRVRSVAADRAVLVDELEKATVKADKAKAAYIKAHKALDEVQSEQRALSNRGRDYAGLDAAGIEKAALDLDVKEAHAKHENTEKDRLRHETGRARFNAEKALEKFDENAL